MKVRRCLLGSELKTCDGVAKRLIKSHYVCARVLFACRCGAQKATREYYHRIYLFWGNALFVAAAERSARREAVFVAGTASGCSAAWRQQGNGARQINHASVYSSGEYTSLAHSLLNTITYRRRAKLILRAQFLLWWFHFKGTRRVSTYRSHYFSRYPITK